MSERKEDISSSIKPFFFLIALGAIFLFATVSLQSPHVDQKSFLASVADASKGSFLGALSAERMAFPEAPELLFVGKEAILATTPPITVTPQVLGAIVGQFDGDLKREITKYAVEQGDTIAVVAEKFGVSVQTIADANDLNKDSTLKPGQELVILPVSGALHLVRPHDTLSEIAGWYQANVQEIVSFNGFATASEIFAGDLLVIPGGITPRTLPAGRLTPLPNSYFIYPLPSPHRITQGLHTYNAIDFSNGICGESIYAAAGGVVQRTGYTSLGGNYVRILHPNGVVTYYGHLSGAIVAPGAKVYQGQTIGYMGQTGFATGCHVHFEVRGASNPFIP